jgi:hypothetical protein
MWSIILGQDGARKIALHLLTSLFLLCWAHTAHSAVVSVSSDPMCVLKLDGEIVDGDLDRLKSAAATKFKGVDGESSAHDTICLNSPGGSVLEGVQLSSYFYERGIGTVIAKGSECYSICAIMFMMGIAQGPEVNFVNRKLHVRGKLGFHRPYLAINTDELVSARVMSVVHDNAIESITRIMILANNRVPWSNSTMMRSDLVQEMLKHIGEDLFYIDSVDKAGRFEIELFGNKEIKGLEERQAYYACENSFHWQVGLLGKETDFDSFKDTMSESGATNVVTQVASTDGSTLYSVVSSDAGYSEAGCLIGIKDGLVRGCGYNGEYNVSIGQGGCTAADFSDRAVVIQTLALQKPGLDIATLEEGGASLQPEVPLIGAACKVIGADGKIDAEPCSVAVVKDATGQQTIRYEFVWPSGNKTIISRDGQAYLINGKPAEMSFEDKNILCALNTVTRNSFCFSMAGK